MAKRKKELVELFKNEEFGEIRVTIIDGKEYFSGKDCAKALGYVNPSKAIRDHCKEQGVTKQTLPTKGGKQEVKFISEGNLYRLIVRSKLESAEKFESWVFDIVLPSIRKTGKYEKPKKSRLKKESTKARNFLTEGWKTSGVKNPWEYAQLTVHEYKLLGFEDGKRKPNMTEEEILCLLTMESIESFKLLKQNKQIGFNGCYDSLNETKTLLDIIGDSDGEPDIKLI